MRKSNKETRSRVGTSKWVHRGVLVAGVALGAVVLTAGPFGTLRAEAAAPIGLGTLESFAVLAGSTVTNTGPSTIWGDVGVSAGTALVGMPEATISGVLHSADAVAGQAQVDLTAAYNEADGLDPDHVVATELADTSPEPGVYTDGGGGLGLSGTIVLDGDGSYDSVWVFQSSSTITTAGTVSLINGAQACNVFWQADTSVTLGTGTVFAGTVMANASISAVSGVTVQGRLLARTGAVTLINDVITEPPLCLTGSVDGGDDDDNDVGGVTITSAEAAAAADIAAAADAAALLALSGTDATPGIIWAATFFAIGIGAVALGRRLNPRGAHRMN